MRGVNSNDLTAANGLRKSANVQQGALCLPAAVLCLLISPLQLHVPLSALIGLALSPMVIRQELTDCESSHNLG